MDKENSKAQHQIIKSEGYTTLRLVGDLGMEGLRLFEEDIPKITGEPYVHLIVNCDHLSGMDKNWVRSLLAIEREIRKTNMELRFVLLSRQMKEYIKNEGLEKAFKSCLNLRDALVELKLTTKKMLDTDFINPFLSATVQVLKVQTQTEAKQGKIYIKTDKDSFSGDVSGVIGLVSESFNGSVVISFPEATFLAVMSRMLGEAFTTLTKEIADGAGELTNMIFGQAKVVLNEKGYGIKTALPSVVSGKNHSVSVLTNGPIVVVPFESDIGPFFIEICLSG